MRPRDIWTVGAIFTLGERLEREADLVMEFQGLPGAAGQARKVPPPLHHHRVTESPILMFPGYKAMTISQVIQNQSSRKNP